METKYCPRCSRLLKERNISLYCTGCRKWFCLDDPRIGLRPYADSRQTREQMSLLEEKFPVADQSDKGAFSHGCFR